jgi:hypothetical protein
MFQIGRTGACQLPLDRDNDTPCWFSQLRKLGVLLAMVNAGRCIKDG